MAKVVAHVWETKFIQFLAALAVLHRSMQGIVYILPPKQARRPLPLLLSPSFSYGKYKPCTYDCFLKII